MFTSFLGSILLLTQWLTASAATYPTLDRLAGEAETLQSERPNRWNEYQKQVDDVFAKHDKLVAKRKARSNPPPPDLTPLKQPLPFLVSALRQEEKALTKQQAAKGGRGQYPWTRHLACLTAIAHSADERRVPVLLEYRDMFTHTGLAKQVVIPWGKLIADAATVNWAAAQISTLAPKEARLDYASRRDNVLYCLIDGFAGQLPADATKTAYAYLRKQTPDGPLSYDTEQIWDLLFRLDGRRAGKEILPYFGRPSGAKLRYNYHAVVLLAKHPGPSPEMAAAVRQWLANQTDLMDYNKEQLRLVLQRAEAGR